MSAMLRHNARAALLRTGGAVLSRPRATQALPRVPLQHALQQRCLSAGRYVEQMREAWKKDPTSVHESWDSYFSKEPDPSAATELTAGSTVSSELQEVASDHIKMLLLVRSYQARGHYMCKLDPLGINDANLHVDKFAYRGGQEQAVFRV
jgi:2-oxoglutarate dehydrogenase complex dehydrogenase (E1) component-like enzyme